MTINQLIKVLKQAKKDFGDVPVMLLDSETGANVPIMEVQKLHPYTGQYGCLNRSEPVNGIRIQDWSSATRYSSRSDLCVSDLSLYPTSKD